MEDYDKKHNLLTQLGIKYSAGLNDLYSKLEAGEKAHDNLKEKLNNLYIYIVELRKSRLKESLNHCTSSFYVYEENLLDADNILRVIKDFAGDSPYSLPAVRGGSAAHCPGPESGPAFH